MSGDEAKEPVPEIVIIKRGRGGEEGHHGGVWKIAYADFMTAMMAFFLVMWLVNAANEKTKSQVASYFNPVKLIDTRTSNKGLQSMDTGDGESWDKRDTAGVSKKPPDERKKRTTRTWKTPLVEPKPKRSSGSVLKDPFVVGLNGGDTSQYQGESVQTGKDGKPVETGEPPNAEATRVLEALVQGDSVLAGENMQALVAAQSHAEAQDRPETGAVSLPNQGNGDKPDVGSGDKPDLGKGDKPNIGAGEKPNIGAGEKANVGAGDKPNIGAGEEPDVGAGDKPNVGSGDRPNLGAGDKPNVDAGDKTNLGMGEKPDIGAGEKPDMGVGGKPGGDPPDKPGQQLGKMDVAELSPAGGEAPRGTGATAGKKAAGELLEVAAGQETRLGHAGERVQRKLAQSKKLGSLNGVDVTVSPHAEGSLISLVEG